MKRIVFFDGTLLEGGAERVISILSKQMVESGYTVEILLFKSDKPFYQIDSCIKITHVANQPNTKSFIGKLLFVRHYFKEHADIVISFLAPFNMVAITANLCNGIPIVVADRNDPRKVPQKYVVRKLRDFLYKFANGIVVQTDYNFQYFSKDIQKKSRIIYNPIMLGEDEGIALDTKKRKEIVSVGRLMPQKNHRLLIQAFKNVHEKYEDYRLIIYGDGPERAPLLELIDNLHLEDAVSLPGNQQDIFQQIASAEMFVLSSNFEGMPNALIEAMCLGLPCISTKVSGASDLIKHEENGLLVPVDDRSSLEKAMIYLIESEEMRAKLAKSAVKLNQELRIDKITEKWITFLGDMEKGQFF